MASPAIRKRLAVLREALRAPLRPGGQSESVLRTLDRMRSAKQRAEEQDATAYRIRLSPLATLLSAVVMIAAIGWAYFMGYMIGLGENPARQVASLTGSTTPEQEEATVLNDDQPYVPEGVIKEDALPEDAPSQANQKQPEPPAKDASNYPFAKPKGSSLAAWGENRGTAAKSGQASEQTDKATPATPSAGTAAPLPASSESKSSQLYDFVFQIASFKKQEDAERLCQRLETDGLRCRIQKSGSLHVVQNMLRGTDQQGIQRREYFQGMGLGRPIQKSKKAVKK